MTTDHGEDPKKPPSGPPKDFTTSIPMIDLGEAVKVVRAIYDKGLENSPMDDVAAALKYKKATSSPFYYRMRAARLFGLLSSKAELSQKAKDYINPHEEGMAESILKESIMGIPTYAELVRGYTGKKLNVEMLANRLVKERNLTPGCALYCAKAFETSIKFAGLLSDDGVVDLAGTKPCGEAPNSELPLPTREANDLTKTRQKNPVSVNSLVQTMYLDKTKTRVFEVIAPVTITKAEYERICKWLGVVMIVEDSTEETHE
jgi:hypothetical protein